MSPLRHWSGPQAIGALAVWVGGLVLLGWALDIAALKSVMPGWVSMKPNTAVAFILTGFALRLSRPTSDFRRQLSTLLCRLSLSRFCALFAGLIGLLSLCEYAFGWNTGFDQWLFPEPAGTVGTSHPGRMAPDTALCFLLFAAGWEFARRPRQTDRTRIAALLLGAAMITVALVEILSYFTPVLRTYGWGGLTMMALPTATLFAALGIALVLAAQPGSPPKSVAPANAPAAPDARAGWLLVTIFLLLAAGIVSAGIFYYRGLERQFRAVAEQQLAAIADLKVGELTQWRNERLGAAAILHNNPVFTQLVRRLLAAPMDADAQQQLLAWFGRYQKYPQYDRIRLLDPQGVTRLSIPAGLAPTSSATARSAAEVLRSGQVSFQDFFRNDHDQRVYLAVQVPVLDEADGNRPLGVVVLRIDPDLSLYPSIGRWPVSSATAETLLVRREGDEAVFLNELRFRANTALSLRVPLTHTDMPTVKAALGQEGIVEGRDYRGAPALAALRAVPDSPWFLVARRNSAEVFAPLRARLWQVLVLVCVLLLGAAAGVGLVWRQQRVRFHRKELAAAGELQASGHLAQATLDALSAHIAVLDEAGAIIAVNRAWRAFAEANPPLASNVNEGVNYLAVCDAAKGPDADVARAAAAGIRAVIRGTESTFAMEYPCHSPDAKRWFVCRVNRFPGSGTARATVAHEDITERKRLDSELRHNLGLAEQSRRALLGILEEQKRAEAALRTSEQRYRRLVANTETGLVVIDDKGTVISANEPYRRLTGAREIADVVGHSVMEWTAPDEKENNARAVALCAGRGFIQDFETVYQHADGTRTDVSINATVEATSDAGIRIASLCRNITERKRAERAVQESRQLVESVVENVPLMIFLKEATDLRFVVFNRAGEELLGYDRKALLGKNNLDLFPPEQAAHFMAKDREALAGPGVVDIPEESIMTVKRGERLLHTRKVCIRGGDGKTRYLLGISEDITERKRAEAEHEKLQAQFAQAQKMDSVGRLAGGVAHDFNNLLMGMMGYVDLCRDTVAPDHPMREWLDEIMHDAQRSAEITRQLLAFARKQVIAPRVLDLNDAVAGMLKLLRRLIGEDIHLAWRPGAALQPVKLDPSQIDQVLANLCVNSRDAIAGVGEITLETTNATVEAGYSAEHPEVIPGAYAVLAVSDNGCGMDKETLAQVFEPFFTTKGPGKGTGLGLATVYGIVKQNRGFINVYSEPGKGTTFKIHLPAVAAEADVCVTSKPEMPRGRGEAILLVEDEKSMRVTCGLFLKALGYEVLLAASPAEALKLTDQHPGDIHVLLTDVVMPGMDGRQLAQRISAVKAGVKVVFMSGYTADVIAQRGVLDEGLQFLSKPFTRDDLARKVREVLEAG